MKKETKQVAAPLQATTLDEALGTGAAYLSVFNVVDKQKDVVVPGAFLGSIARMEADRNRRHAAYLAPMLWQHQNEPVGGFTSMVEDSYGLRVEFECDMTTEIGRRAYSALKRQYVGGLSIGYHVIKDKMRSDGVRLLLELDLIEGSVVTFPANDLATPLVDSMKYEPTREETYGAIILSMQGAIDNHKKRHGARTPERNTSMNNDDYCERPLYGGSDYSQYQEQPDRGFRIVPGEDPMEDPLNFQKEIRAQLRAEDDAYMLGDKAREAEFARRKQERDARWQAKSEALAADRKAIADARIEPLEEYTVAQLAAKSGIEIGWLLRLVQACVNGGEVTPAVEGTLVLKGSDFMKLGKRHHAEFETQFVSAARKRAERLAREKRAS